MNEIGKEYGAALFQLALEENETRRYAEALETVKHTFHENPLYSELLSSSGIPLKERFAMIETAFSGAVPQHVLSFLKLLCEKRRIVNLPEAIQEYEALLDAAEHVSQVKVTSAVPLSEEEKSLLIKKLETMQNGKVQPEYCVDPALLGGITVEIDGKIMDGSLRHRLHEVKEVMNS